MSYYFKYEDEFTIFGREELFFFMKLQIANITVEYQSKIPPASIKLIETHINSKS